MTTFLVRPPAVEPVSLADVRAHLRLDGSDEDVLLARLIAAARAHVEGRTGRAMIDQGWRCVLDAWPARRQVWLRPAPLIALTAVTVIDADGAGRVLAADEYAVDAAAAPARLRLTGAGGAVEPGSPLNGIEIDFDAGYGTTAAAVPAPLVQALLMLVAHWHENREAAAIGAIAAPLAVGVECLIAPYRVARL